MAWGVLLLCLHAGDPSILLLIIYAKHNAILLCGKASCLLTMPVPTTDENFFGPVSASFIQIGRPSDSGMSEDDNHDITMDSRTFSMHFRNIAPPDDCTANSAASLMTPNTACEGPLKELTASNPAIASISGQDSLTDMSLLSGNPRTYDYGKLSPGLSSMMNKVGVSDVTPGCVLTLSTSEKESREEILCIDSGISSDKLVMVNAIVEHISMRNPVSTSTDLIQEDNEMIIDGQENSQVRY